MNWDKASTVNIKNYKTQIEHYKNQYVIPDEIINCKDFLCKKHDEVILQKLDELFNILIVSAHDNIPVQNVNGKKGIPGWNDFVKPYKEKSIFWNDIWKSAGMPNTGQLAELRKFTRAKYHWAIKQVKREKNNIILNNTAKQLASKSFCEFWITVKKLNGNKRTIANIVDDKNSDNEIAVLFNDKYNELYNSVSDDNFNATVKDVEKLVYDKCNKNLCNIPNNHNVTDNVIKNAIMRLKKGKDDEVYEMYSEHFINAPESMHAVFGKIISCMLRHGTTSQIINKSIIKPIPKDKQKSLSDSSNYRAISKNSIISKIIDYVIMQLIDDKMKTSTYQFGYKESFSTSLCSFLVSETIQYYRSKGSNVYMTLLDCTKAFDKIQHTKLFKTLMNKNICPSIIRLIMNSYIMSTAVVKWNNSTATPFKINNGVKQGGVMSAPLFALYIDPLLKKLNSSKQGCYIGHLAANAFGYADDIVLLTPSCEALKNLIKICENFAEEYKLNFNPKKCKILVYSTIKLDTGNIDIKIAGHKIEIVKSEKHLGHTFQTAHNIINLENVIKDIRIRTNVIVNKFRPVSWQAKVTLFQSQCSSLYGCHLWRLDDPSVDNLCTTWKVCSRKILGLSTQTRSYMLNQIMGTLPIKDVIMSRILNFFVSGLNHDNTIISDFFKNKLVSNSSYMLTNINAILTKFNFNGKFA